MTEDERLRVGVDIGGTFTDVVLMTDGGLLQHMKVLSTPEDYSLGIVDGIEQLLERAGRNAKDVQDVVHATTVATNTILEHKGAKTALVTTRGFQDVLEMRRLRIPVLYDLQYNKPRPLVPRRFRHEISGRIGPSGEEWEALDHTDVSRISDALREDGIESVAVCLLHAYANPTHEQQVADGLRDNLGPEVYICTSSDILPEIREYERTSTTVVNAYVGPVVERYLESLTNRLAEAKISSDVHIMLSNGGVMTIPSARRKPAYLVESGPAAGVIACARSMVQAGHSDVISFDMGGTTAKAAIIEHGQVTKTTEYEVGAGINLSSKLVKGGGYPVKLPFIDVSEIGAGGGSLIKVDPTPRVFVGPESAGADPGPICYQRGGKEPTLTDVLVALGYVSPKAIAGGAIALNAELAIAAVTEEIARPLGMSVNKAAYGVLQLACATMTRAVKAVSTYRGRDPRDFTLVAFGGNGPVVAVEVARTLQMSRVLIPPAPGVFSAVGLLFSDIENELVRTVLGRWSSDASTASSAIEHTLQEMEEEARKALPQNRPNNETPIQVERQAELRYRGQAYELPVSVPPGKCDLEQMEATFHREHERTYGYRSDREPVDLVNLKVLTRIALSDRAAVFKTEAVEPTVKRDVYFGAEETMLSTPIGPRTMLGVEPTEGPLIIEDSNATCVIPPGCRALLDEAGNIDIQVGETL